MAINTLLYIEKYLKIKTKEGKITGFCLNMPQKRLYDALKAQHKAGKPQRAIVLKARQMGFSTLTEAIIFKQTATAHNVSSGIVTHKDDATTNLFNMFKRFYDYLPTALKPRVKASNAKELIFSDKNNSGLNSAIKCMTAGGDGVGRSYTFLKLHVSEYGFWPGNKKATLTGLMQAVPNTPNSLVVIESTANGFEDFKTRWDDAVNGRSDFVAVFVGWNEMEEYRMPYDGFELTKEEKQLKKAFALDNEQLAWRRWCISNNCGGDMDLFHQEYPITPEEAFVSTGTCIFDKRKILQQIAIAPKPVRCGQFVFDYDGLRITNIKWEEDESGAIMIYVEPQEKTPYVIGGDTAGDGSDWFIGQVLDNTTGRQVAKLRHLYDEDVYSRQMYCLGLFYNTALIGIEVNYSTFPVKELERLKYPNLYVRETEDNYTHKPAEKFGFKTTSLTRPVIIAGLKEIARDNIEVIVDRETLYEMLVFIKNEKGRPEAQVGEHDDCVMALAIAHYIRPQQRMRKEKEKKAAARWEPDQWEDYNNASAAEKRKLIERWGDPFGE